MQSRRSDVADADAGCGGTAPAAAATGDEGSSHEASNRTSPPAVAVAAVAVAVRTDVGAPLCRPSTGGKNMYDSAS